MTNMATMPIYGKNLKNSSPEPIDRWPWNLVCSIVYASTTKVVQIMTLDWPWPILHQGQIWLHRLLYGRKWIVFFETFCSLRSQSRLKHSAKWVNEVEWVSKVNVILWTWPKVIQISKLNVWLWPVYSGERFRASWPSCYLLWFLFLFSCFTFFSLSYSFSNLSSSFCRFFLTFLFILCSFSNTSFLFRVLFLIFSSFNFFRLRSFSIFPPLFFPHVLLYRHTSLIFHYIIYN